MATADEHGTIAPILGSEDPRRFTDSGIEIKPLYTERDLPADLPEHLGEPGDYPYTRGVHRDMYRKQLWTMRQYAGYASAKESNERYRYLLQHGSTGLSMAFDLPTQLGLDSDDPRCLGEVGRTGVAIDTIDDMRTAFDEIPLDQVSTSMTINAPAAVLLLLYELVGEEQGVPSEQLRGTTQNDILKEYIARGTYIYPPRPSMRIITDLFAFAAQIQTRRYQNRLDNVRARLILNEGNHGAGIQHSDHRSSRGQMRFSSAISSCLRAMNSSTRESVARYLQRIAFTRADCARPACSLAARPAS